VTLSKRYEYTINIKEITSWQVTVVARNEEDAVELALELDRADYHLNWYDVDDVDIVDKELVGQW